ncbi:alpha-L-rhamnosidase [Curtobacterium sp. MCPF17_011]|uniref:alpha-L-rhamnosidase n=1 Tax=Curtobacterium sp. MCPF17_011 TaxID=2175652 RepID=UPI000DA7ABC2|nr:alpha-L-rhamnosidase [Curtobacterium sp. MCPF17_011]PZF09996.1 alpha-L-rhamnosidase [Curtobacterium sp. MCPF17_011]
MTSASIMIERVRVGREAPGRTLGDSTPPITWILVPGGAPQAAYEIRVQRAGRSERTTGLVQSTDSQLIAWPDAPLRSREHAVVEVRVQSEAGDLSNWSEPVTVEASLLHRDDWRVNFVVPSPDAAVPDIGGRPATLLRADFVLPSEGVSRVRLYSTAHGAYELEVNGRQPTHEVLAPGWSSFKHRIRFQTAILDEVTRPGANTIGVWLADGWYRGRLGFNGGLWDNYGSDASILAQLEVTDTHGNTTVVPLDWRWCPAPVTATALYDGEQYDARLLHDGWSSPGFDSSSWAVPQILPLDHFPAALEPATAGPVAVTGRLTPVEMEVRANGRIRFDFGQNIAGRLRVKFAGERGSTVSLHHAEVLEGDELAVRPLRSAPSVDHYTFAGIGREEWAPRFTYHGFRYAELDGWDGPIDDLDVVAEILHTDMERTGWFDSSHELLNRLHENTVWGMRGNFLDLPTDCPQRDERLGWTGDIEVFAPAAAFLHESAPLLRNWLRDLSAEQSADGAVPNFVPWIECGFPEAPAAAWGDAAVIVPWTLYERTGDASVLEDQYTSMVGWVEYVERRSAGSGLWNGDFQLGDWLDPTAPPDHPGDARTDSDLVATAYFVRSADLLSRAASVLGRTEDVARYRTIAENARAAFLTEYATASGRLVSDTPTALSLALVFNLLQSDEQRTRAGDRLVELVRFANHRIQTGFVGTPIICDALVQAGAVDTAYDLLLQERFPSWLFPVTMGATTIWERWDSMLPDGRVNPGEMTSFNHYALGAVVDFMHRRVAGLAPAEPGYRSILVEPGPGGGLQWASARHRTPFGEAAVAWSRVGGALQVEVTIPPGSRGIIRLPANSWVEQTVGPGRHSFQVPFRAPGDDPARPVRVDPHAHSDPDAPSEGA